MESADLYIKIFQLEDGNYSMEHQFNGKMDLLAVALSELMLSDKKFRLFMETVAEIYTETYE